MSNHPSYRRRAFRSRAASTHDMFMDYIAISAKYDSTAHCGHEVRTGDSIGYNPDLRRVRCTECWAAWCSENAEASRMETQNY